MENLFRGLPGVAVYLDDILVTGESAEQHDSNLRSVLQKLSESGLRLKREKCHFRLPEVRYLGFRVSAEGLQVLDDRVRVITDMSAPTSVTELQSFLGLVTYYNQFIPHLSTVLEPLHMLLRKGQAWVWGEQQEEAVNKVKEMLRSTPVLVHYDPSLPLLLTVDSSSFGLGCVLAHVMKDGTHKPIAFKSRKLTSAERNYSQLDKEALAVLYGVKKFHNPGEDSPCPETVLAMETLDRSLVPVEQVKTGTDQDPVLSKEAQSPPPAPLHPWEFPPKPWYRVHMDFAGPVLGRMLLVIVDSYSKWIEVHDMKKITAQATIEKCRQTFSIHGLPHTVVTDNGPTFISSAFESFLQANGVRLVHSSPYHAASNGLAENAVKTVKNGLKKMKSIATLRGKLSRFLFRYRITPHTTTGQTPAELLMGRLPRSRLSLVRPDLSERVIMKQSRQVYDHDRRCRARIVTVGDNVFVKNFPSLIPRWIPGVVMEQLSPLSFRIQLQTGRVVQRHLDHVRQRLADVPDDYPRPVEDGDGRHDDDHTGLSMTEKAMIQPDGMGEILPNPVFSREVCVPRPAEEQKPATEEEAPDEAGAAATPVIEAETGASPRTGSPQPRRSGRTTKGVPPLRLGY
ncbi:uncharacterized protein K02A2.6-like [Portunus trituberculatus]|uniref:uncharacterized protein K02A2.6-like n=1 Tax=Portunus trituberculatus TaxID=210409 RepID=UPI001E1D1EBF|nr:uncharacterized protein K02A2.6-like [Portunus trituberculatus]